MPGVPPWTHVTWVNEPDLLADEEVLWHRRANREQGSLRQVGGKLFLTDHRIHFTPNRFDDPTGGEAWICELADLADVAAEPRRHTIPFLGQAAQLRRRLRLDLRDGAFELFVINRVDDAVRRFRAALGA